MTGAPSNSAKRRELKRQAGLQRRREREKRFLSHAQREREERGRYLSHEAAAAAAAATTLPDPMLDPRTAPATCGGDW